MAVAVGMMAAGTTSQAAIVLSNLTATISSTQWFQNSNWAAQSFDTNAQAWVLNAVTISSDTTNAFYNTGNFFVDIYDSSGIGNSRIPGALLGSLSGTDKPFPNGDYTYTTSGISLSPSSRYWLVMGVSSGTANYDLNYAEDVAATGVWSYPYGGSWGGIVAESSNQGGSWSLSNYGPFLLEFDATAVPEPSTYAMALAGLACGALFRRRKQA